jgi:leader peptidase (prepilin peptidase)/N-methyltransferase
MTILLTVLFTLLGVSVGSFLNVCIDRLPQKRSLFFPGSACDECRRKLSTKDMVPVVSYLWLRGKCRYCGAKIPLRVLMVEVLTGLLFFLAFWQFGLSAEFAITAFWCSIFLVIMFIDWEQKLILNKITYPSAIIALVILSIDSIINEPIFFPERVYYPTPAILSGVISAFVLLVIFLFIIIIRPGSMGMGDAKLVALIGLITGFPLVIFGMLIGVLIGGLVAIILLSFRLKGRKDIIPYGTFLAIGPIVVLLWGNEILDWYLNLNLS